MSGWLVLAGYLLGLPFSWRWLAKKILVMSTSRYRKNDSEDRTFAKGAGLFVAIFWPLIVPAWLLYNGSAKIVFPNDVKTDEEINEERAQREQEAEIAKNAILDGLRAKAKHYNLPGWE